ncbi:MAG: T9SS type A sorting domain-containing protein, partial [Sphingobacteriales bacterium]
HKAHSNISTNLSKAITFNGNTLYLTTHRDSAGMKTILMEAINPATLVITKSKSFGLLQEDNSSQGNVKRIRLEFNQGNIWMLASHVGTLNFAHAGGTINHTLGFNERGYFVAKLNANWDVTDAKFLHKTKQHIHSPIRLGFDASDNILLVGSVADSFDADPGPSTTWIKPPTGAFSVGYMAYYNQSMALQWAKTFGTGADNFIDGVGFGKNKRIYITGDFRGTGDFSLVPPAVNETSENPYYDSYFARYYWPTAGTTSIKDGVKNIFGVLYPNPAKEQVVVETALLSVTSNATVTILDGLGRIVKSEMATAGQARLMLDVSGLVPGTYYIRVTSEKGTYIERFTKI